MVVLPSSLNPRVKSAEAAVAPWPERHAAHDTPISARDTVKDLKPEGHLGRS